MTPFTSGHPSVRITEVAVRRTSARRAYITARLTLTITCLADIQRVLTLLDEAGGWTF